MILSLLVIVLSNKPEVEGSTINDTKCTFHVEEKSAIYFKKWLKIVDGMVAHLKLKFVDNKTYDATDDVLFPDMWMWTFVPPGGAGFYITWPVDYYVYSFGLLDTHTLKNPVELYLKTFPENCTIKFGDQTTVNEIGNAMYNMSERNKFYKINEFYDYSYWCYTSTYSHFHDSTFVNLNKYLGVPLRLYGYKCCYFKYGRGTEECGNHFSNVWNPYQILPFLIGIIFFFYFPIALIKCSHRAIDSGIEIKRSHMQYSNLSSDDDDYLFLKRRGPITVSDLFMGLFGLASKHPVLASKIRRVFFVCCSPFIVYIFIIIYYCQAKTLIEEVVKHKIPMGFVSMLGGFTESIKLFLPMFGGPVISLILYVCVGLILMLFPRDIGEVLELGLPPDKYRFSTLLKMDLATVEVLSGKECQVFHGYRKVYSVFRGNVYMFINPFFWSFVFTFHINRWKAIIDIICTCCLGSLWRILIYFPFFIFYFCFCVVETILLCCYNGLPVCFFVVIAIRGYAKYFRRSQRNQTVMPYIFISVIYALFLLFFIFMLVMITLQSFTIIGYFIFFLYLSLVIFPSRSFGYVYYFIMFVVYVHNTTKQFKEEYQELLLYTINASVKLEKLNTAKDFLKNSRVDSTESNTLSLIAMTKLVSIEMVSMPLSIQQSAGHEYVKYKNQIPGIRKDLFQYVVARFRPVHIAFFHFVLQIAVVQILVLVSIVFISTYIKNVTSRQASDVLNVMSVVIVTMIPNLISIFFVHVHNNKVRKRKVRQRVVDFWKEKNIE